MAPKWAPKAPKMTPKAPKMVPRALKIDPQMAETVPKSSENGPNIKQTASSKTFRKKRRPICKTNKKSNSHWKNNDRNIHETSIGDGSMLERAGGMRVSVWSFMELYNIRIRLIKKINYKKKHELKHSCESIFWRLRKNVNCIKNTLKIYTKCIKLVFKFPHPTPHPPMDWGGGAMGGGVGEFKCKLNAFCNVF